MITLAKFIRLVEEMCRQVEQGKFKPILEADLNCFLYHSIIAKELCLLSKIHSDTRVISSKNKNKRYDLVVGVIEPRDEDGRPAATPKAIIEIKIFPAGFQNAQHSRHFSAVLESDLPKLGALKTKPPVLIEFIFDEVDYLSKQIKRGKYEGHIRRDVIRAKRNKVAREVKVVIARKDIGKGWKVDLLKA